MAETRQAPSNSQTETKKKQRRRIAHNATLSRWESVRREEFLWLRPFKELPIDRAMAYLEDLRKITEQAGHIMQQRIGDDKEQIKCATCKRRVDGLRPNGMPVYVNKSDYRDAKTPEIIRSRYFCSELCMNQFVRKSQGAMGNTAPSVKTV